MVGDGAEYFHSFGKISADSAHDRACFDSYQVFSVRNNDAFYVFNQVSAAFCDDVFRYSAEHVAGFGAGECNGDRFRTAQSGNKFFMKYIKKFFGQFFIHKSKSFGKSYKNLRGDPKSLFRKLYGNERSRIWDLIRLMTDGILDIRRKSTEC